MADIEPEQQTEAQPPEAAKTKTAATTPEPAQCKACDEPAQQGSMFCKDHQNKLLHKYKKRWITRTDVILTFCVIALLIGYPRLVGPPRVQWILTEGWRDQLGAQVMAGLAHIGLTSAQSGERQALPGSDKMALPAGQPPSSAAGSAPARLPRPDRHNSSALAALSQCGNGIIEPGEDCDGLVLGGATCQSLGFSGDCGPDDTCVRPGLTCLPSCAFDYAGCTTESEAAVQRFVSNGNGTATDRLTGLMWEQKCTALACPDQHQVSATLPWRTSATQWVNGLNEERFAGHDDWRLPSLEELRTLLAAIPPCSAEPCAGAVWSRAETAAAGYWTSTTFAVDTTRAWAVSFGNGDVYTAEKGDPLYVRAVCRAF